MMTNSKKIKHLYSRAGFSLSPKEWNQKKSWTIQQATKSLFDDAQNVSVHIHKVKFPSNEKFNKKDKEGVIAIGLDWIERMTNPEESALLERMSLFWHGHFACTSKSPVLAIQQLHTIREHALGNFRDLLIGIAKDPSMIRYLNNKQNKKDSPNENFARELLELFTIGRGHYTEVDVKEAARAFTGWSSNEHLQYEYKARHHDEGIKSFMGTNGNFNGEDIIHIILERKETAHFITKKIYRYFVNDQVDEQRVKELAHLLYTSDYHIGTLMQHIFQSDWFYASKNVGAKIKSPIDLIVGIIRSFNVKFENKEGLLTIQKALGQELFDPPNVAGWPGSKHWIDNSTLMLRLNLVAYLFMQSEIGFNVKQGLDELNKKGTFKKITVKIDLQYLVDKLAHLENSEIIDTLMMMFLPNKPASKNALLQKYSPAESKENFIRLATMQIMSLPEYQMT